MRLLVLGLLLPLAAACTDGRGLNAYEARCVDRGVKPGTPELRGCAAQEEQAFINGFRREHYVSGGGG